MTLKSGAVVNMLNSKTNKGGSSKVSSLILKETIIGMNHTMCQTKRKSNGQESPEVLLHANTFPPTDGPSALVMPIKCSESTVSFERLNITRHL